MQGSAVPGCSAGVMLVFRGALLFRHYFGVFLRCSVSRCSWFYSIPSQREEIRSWEMPLANAISQEKTKYLRKRKIYSNTTAIAKIESSTRKQSIFCNKILMMIELARY